MHRPIRQSFASPITRTRHGSTGSARVVRTWSAILGTAIVALAGVVLAIEDTTFEVERVVGAGWHAEGVRAWLDLSDQGTRIHASVTRLALESPAQELRDVRIECDRASVSS